MMHSKDDLLLVQVDLVTLGACLALLGLLVHRNSLCTLLSLCLSGPEQDRLHR